MGGQRASWKIAPYFAEAAESRKVALLPSDIQVKEGNNVYVVRLDEGVAHILIPAYQNDDCPSGDSMLSPYEKERIIEIALGPSAHTKIRSLTVGLQKRADRGKAVSTCVRTLGTTLHHKFERCCSATQRIVEFVRRLRTPRFFPKKKFPQGEIAAGLNPERDTPAIRAARGISSPQHPCLPKEATVDEWNFVPEGKQRVWCNLCEMLSIDGVPCHESDCPNVHKVWDPNALSIYETNRPDRQYGEWVAREQSPSATERPENYEAGKGRDGDYVIYAQEEHRLRDPKCREEKQEVDRASSEKEAEKLVGDYKIGYARGRKVGQGVEKNRLRRCFQSRVTGLLEGVNKTV
jgi:hypothetical protein